MGYYLLTIFRKISSQVLNISSLEKYFTLIRPLFPKATLNSKLSINFCIDFAIASTES